MRQICEHLSILMCQHPATSNSEQYKRVLESDLFTQARQKCLQLTSVDFGMMILLNNKTSLCVNLVCDCCCRVNGKQNID